MIILGDIMVSSVSGSTPYSYLNQLVGSNKSSSSAPTAAAAIPINTITDTANALGLSPTVVNLLQNLSGKTAVSALLSTTDKSTDPLLGLLGTIGQSFDTSASDLLNAQYSNLLSTSASSDLYQAALNGAADKELKAAKNTNYMDMVLAAYDTALNQTNNAVGNNLNTTG